MDKVFMQLNQLAEMANQMQLKNQDKQLISSQHGMIEIKWK